MTTPTPDAVSIDHESARSYEDRVAEIVEELKRVVRTLDGTRDNHLEPCFIYDNNSLVDSYSSVVADKLNFEIDGLEQAAERLDQIKVGIKASEERFKGTAQK